MPEMSSRPPRTPWLSPYLTVASCEAALAFYQRAFGFEKREAVPGPDGRTMHAEMNYQDGLIMMGVEGAYGSVARAPRTTGTATPVGLYVYCEDVDALHARAVAAGAVTVTPPQDTFWGDRMCRVLDPDGHAWNFATFLHRENQ